MARPDITATITRTDLGLSNLVLDGGLTAGRRFYLLEGFRLPETVSEVHYPTPSKWFAGSSPTSKRLAQTNMVIPVEVVETSIPLLLTAVDELEAALTQLSYTIAVSIAGNVTTWRCFAGTVTPYNGDVRPDDIEEFTGYYIGTVDAKPIPV